tara:strand:+ start:777 stop:1232 length:456 start_codon:yes stop_codon:yes gene_type:complete
MKNNITSELTQAIKSGNKNRTHTLRLILAAIKDKEIANRSSGEDSEISNESVVQLLKKMVKQRNDSIEMFAKANRNELVDKEKSEIAIIDEFLPQQLGEEETKILCNDAIAKTESSSLKEIGKVIKFLKENSGSSLDISLASKILKEKLQK